MDWRIEGMGRATYLSCVSVEQSVHLEYKATPLPNSTTEDRSCLVSSSDFVCHFLALGWESCNESRRRLVDLRDVR